MLLLDSCCCARWASASVALRTAAVTGPASKHMQNLQLWSTSSDPVHSQHKQLAHHQIKGQSEK